MRILVTGETEYLHVHESQRLSMVLYTVLSLAEQLNEKLIVVYGNEGTGVSAATDRWVLRNEVLAEQLPSKDPTRMLQAAVAQGPVDMWFVFGEQEVRPTARVSSPVRPRMIG